MLSLSHHLTTRTHKWKPMRPESRRSGILRRLAPRSLQTRVRSLLERSHVPKVPCATDRARDGFEAERTITEILLRVAKEQGIALWMLPTPTGRRLATSQAPRSPFAERVRGAIKAHNSREPRQQFTIAAGEVRNRKNFYEFDEEQFVTPAVAAFLRIHPTPTCKDDGDYLLERGVTLEFIEDHEEFLVIPMPGKGPRVYQRDLLPEASLDASAGSPWPFPIDLVYTWVDSDDPIWQRNYDSVKHETALTAGLKAATNTSRWHSHDELKFSMRSIEMYAPFVRNIYIVTNGQRPKWLTEHPRVTVVSHEELYPDPSVLPTFNSNHIETVLHRIPGIAEHFLYLNDDFFFSRPCSPADFFAIGGIGKIFFSPRYLGRGPVLPGDRATMACHKNTRDLLEARFGSDCSQKFQHAPYVMRRSVWDQIESDFGSELAATRANRFRSRADLNGQFLYAYFALLTGSAVPGEISYNYLEVADGHIGDKLAAIEKRRVKVFCVNDSNTDGHDEAESEVRAILTARFPVPAPWEAEQTG